MRGIGRGMPPASARCRPCDHTGDGLLKAGIAQTVAEGVLDSLAVSGLVARPSGVVDEAGLIEAVADVNTFLNYVYLPA